MKISYEVMDESINDFFEKARADKIRALIAKHVSPQEREEIILKAVGQALKEDAGAYSQTFGFRTREGGGTSHRNQAIRLCPFLCPPPA